MYEKLLRVIYEEREQEKINEFNIVVRVFGIIIVFAFVVVGSETCLGVDI